MKPSKFTLEACASGVTQTLFDDAGKVIHQSKGVMKSAGLMRGGSDFFDSVDSGGDGLIEDLLDEIDGSLHGFDVAQVFYRLENE